jgi:hypothetical protein
MSDDQLNWIYLDDYLAENDMTLAEFKERHPYVTLEHTGDGRRTIIDENELSN